MNIKQIRKPFQHDYDMFSFRATDIPSFWPF